MIRLSAILGICTVGIGLLVSVGASQEKDKIKGFLPAGFKALNLTEEQKTRIYSIQKEFKAKFADLDEKLKATKMAERVELMKVLTEDQKKAFIGETAPPKKTEK